ncbi:MAG: DUF5977 domain-containing protein [Ginsengibacter sp.]
MLKKIIIINFVFILSMNSFGQNIIDIQSPKIIPPSPDAAALGEYGQMPVDKSTGIPAINIPLYEIQTPRFKIPISLSYHASGVRVDEMASWVGLGWSLNSGGLVTRTIMGLPDDWGGGFLSQPLKKASDIQFSIDSLYLKYAAHGDIDTQPDQFFYNFNNYSGNFVFGTDNKPLLTPYKPIKISFNTDSGFNIIDEQGNSYNFSTTENVESPINGILMAPVSSWYLTRMISADRSDTVKFIYNKDTDPINEFSFNFMQNIGPTEQQSISQQLWQVEENTNERTYHPLRISQIIFKNGKIDFIPKGNRLDNGNVSLDSIIISNVNETTGQYSRLKSFKLTTDYFYSTLNNSGPYLGNTEAAKHRLILTGVSENDYNNTVVKTHSFQYDSTMLPPLNNFGQDKWGYYNGKYQNFSLLETQQVIADDQGDVFTIGGGVGADRSLSTIYSQAGILKKITYPTKGYTTFDYENNQLSYAQPVTTVLHANAIGFYQETSTVNYTPTSSMLSSGGSIFHIQIKKSDPSVTMPIYPYVQLVQVSNGNILYTATANQLGDIDVTLNIPLSANQTYQLIAVAKGGNATTNSTYLPSSVIGTTYQTLSTSLASVGGLRISSEKNYNNTNSLISEETYKYGADESGGGDLISASLMTNQVTHPAYILPATNSSGNPCAYCLGADLSAHLTTYYGNSIYQLSTVKESPVMYGSITVYNGNTEQNAGKTVYSYVSNPDSILICPTSYMAGIKPIPVTWKNVGPTRVAAYRNLGNNQYALEREDLTDYKLIEKPAARGLIVGYTYETFSIDQNTYQFMPVSNYYWFDYPISSGSTVPNQTITINYSPDGSKIQDTTKYYYGNLIHLQPTRIVHFNGIGDSIITVLNYPQDMVLAGKDPTGIFNSMVTANIISPAVEQYQFKNTKQLNYFKNNYNTFNGSMILRSNVQFSTLNNAPETRVQFNQYDSYGNIIEQQKTNDIKNSYLWDYNHTYPVAEVTNASSSDIAYTSFDADGKGNWTFSGAPSNVEGAITGFQSYSLSNGSITKSGLTSATKYIISYWSKGSVSITGGTQSSPTTGETVDGWSFHSLTITGTTSISISGSTYIDELRLYPSDSRMVTYTYQPLVGMVSKCDENNRILYYEYDEDGRLTVIRDQDKNVLKKICYNYDGQPGNCNVYLNVAQSGNFTKGCNVNYTGNTVTYTVPDKKYSSRISIADANNKAIADVNANGPTYANEVGTCTYNPMISIQGSNSKSSTYQVRFTNNSTNNWYTFILNANSSGLSNLGQIPPGTYTVLFYPMGSSLTATFNINGYTYYGTGATFYNISITSVSTARMY